MLVIKYLYQKEGMIFMNNFIVAPSSRNNLDYLLNSSFDYILIGVDDFCITPAFRLDIDNIIKLASSTSKKIIVSINKMIHNKDLVKLEDILIKINNSLVDKVIFYDLGVLNIAKRINFNKDLIISLEHLNASTMTNDFYYKNGVNYSLITSDITKDEINDIARDSKMNIVVSVFGYLAIFYSRRYLISNYLDYHNIKKEDDIYYIKHDLDYYLIKEEKEGSVIFSKREINLVNDYKSLENIAYYLIDGSFISDDDFLCVLDEFLNNKKKENVYRAFFDKKTVYKIRDENK